MKISDLYYQQSPTPATYFFETQSTGSFNQPDGSQIYDAMIQHYSELKQYGKQIGKTKHGIILQTNVGSDYIIGLNYFGKIPGKEQLGIRDCGPVAFCKFSTCTINNIKYIDVILIHSLTSTHKFIPKLPFMLELCMFMKQHYNLPFIDLTGYQSDDAIKMLRIISKIPNTKLEWLNIKTGEKIGYDFKNDVGFRDNKSKTDWRIIAETNGITNIDDYSLYENLMNNIIIN